MRSSDRHIAAALRTAADELRDASEYDSHVQRARDLVVEAWRKINDRNEGEEIKVYRAALMLHRIACEAPHLTREDAWVRAHRMADDLTKSCPEDAAHYDHADYIRDTCAIMIGVYDPDPESMRFRALVLDVLETVRP